MTSAYRRLALIPIASVLFLAPVAATAQSPFRFEPVKPTIEIEIPTLKFSDIPVQNLEGERTNVSIPWIGEYLAAVYRWAVPVGAILAVVVIMVAGIIWLTSGGAERLSTAKEWIGNAIIGLLLLVGSYVVLNLINPDLIRFRALDIQIVPPTSIDESEDEAVQGEAATELVEAWGTGITGSSRMDVALLEDLRAAAPNMAVQGFGIRVTSSYRSVAGQQQLISKTCQTPPGSATCNPKPDRPLTCMLTNGPASCPHTTGRAIDAWGTKDGEQCILQKTCLADKNACRAKPCQAALIAAMRAKGFCNLASEPWHFEKPKMSRNCS